MSSPDFKDLDLAVCRARIVLSLLVLASIYVDPNGPGSFEIEKYVLITLGLHLGYSLTAFFALKSRVATRDLLRASLLLDLGFATVLTIFTEDATSPSYVFFVFAIIAVGCRSGLRSTVTVTLFSAALYLLAIVFLLHGVQEQFVMRAAYLAIAGYLIGFFGEQRARFESRLREQESLAERQKIARDLHDGYVQALAGVNLRLQSCRGMLSKGNAPAALAELTDLQSGVAREYDEVRSYIRWLANIEDHVVADAGAPLESAATRFEVHAEFAGSISIVEPIMQIVLEGIRNTQRHGRAQLAKIDVREIGDGIKIAIDDNGVGFSKAESPPWTIASRVAQSGGSLKMNNNAPSGARLEIELPAN
jgi:signal transduction histidine kinase